MHQHCSFWTSAGATRVLLGMMSLSDHAVPAPAHVAGRGSGQGFNVDTSTPDLPRAAGLPPQPASLLLRTPTFAKPQRARSPSSPAAAGACRARRTPLTSRCLQPLSPPAAVCIDQLCQENKIQRAEQPQDLAWVGKHQEIKQ